MLDIKKLLAKLLAQIKDTNNSISNINSRLNDNLKIVRNVSLVSSGSISAGGNCAVKQTNISSHIPSGYNLIAAVPRGTQNASCVWWYFEFYGTTVEYRLRNVGSSAVTTSPTANLICVKSGGVCITSILSRLSAIERWWEHVRCKGLADENASGVPAEEPHQSGLRVGWLHQCQLVQGRGDHPQHWRERTGRGYIVFKWDRGKYRECDRGSSSIKQHQRYDQSVQQQVIGFEPRNYVDGNPSGLRIAERGCA